MQVAMMIWKTPRRTIDLTHGGFLMGILNTTPDSFSDGGKYDTREIEHALRMVDEGAEIIDIGGESTRPGAAPVGIEEEIRRTIPVIEALREQSKVLISIDTSKSIVARAAIEAGADIVNDVTGLCDPEMASLCADTGVGVCVMHMHGQPLTMQQNPSYGDDGGVIHVVKHYFAERLKYLTEIGIDSECICFDPGIGFGKTLEHNIAILCGLSDLQLDRPLLLGVSRKSFIESITGERDPEKRDHATAVITALAYQQGIRLHRVHNVAINLQSLQLGEQCGSHK